MTSAYALKFRGTGLNPTKYTLLQALERGGPSTQRALGDLLRIDAATLSRTLRPLARRGLIRADAGDDRREKRWTVTAAGLRRLSAATISWRHAQARLREHLGTERWERLLDDLAAIAAIAQSEE